MLTTMLNTPTRRLIINQSNYIPWKGYFDLIRNGDLFVIFDDAQYTKNDWRNRNQIKTAQGREWLTIPIKTAGQFGQRVCDAQVLENSWAERHWQKIAGAYATAPFFSRYGGSLEALYQHASRLQFLSDVNRLFLEFFCNELGIATPLRWSMDYSLAPGKTERLVDLCRQNEATHYLSGPSGRNYIEGHLFEGAGIALEYYDYAGYRPHRQLHGAFEHAVSVLDLLLNEGPAAPEFLLPLKPRAYSPASAWLSGRGREQAPPPALR
jgi:hypothetical protein